MPSTKQLARWLQQNSNGWTIEGVRGVVPLINEAQNMLMQAESEQTLAFDSSTGNFPAFDTEDGVFEYEMPANIWRVSKVVVDARNPIDLGTYLNDEYGLYSNWLPNIDRMHFSGREYVRIPFIKTRDRTFDSPCRVLFTENPTELEGVYMYRGYLLPTQITSVRINPSLPDSNGLHMRTLLPAAQKLIEAFQTNNWEDALMYIEKELKPIAQKQLDSGEQGNPATVERNEF